LSKSVNIFRQTFSSADPSGFTYGKCGMHAGRCVSGAGPELARDAAAQA